VSDRYHGRSLFPRYSLNRRLGKPQNRLEQLEEENTSCPYRESNHGSSIVHPVLLVLHDTRCPGSRSELFVHTTPSVMGNAVQLHLGFTWLQPHTGLRAEKGPRGPVQRGLVEPKDGLDMYKNPRLCRELNHCPDRTVLNILTELL
jgi:hypothetical protein